MKVSFTLTYNEIISILTVENEKNIYEINGFLKAIIEKSSIASICYDSVNKAGELLDEIECDSSDSELTLFIKAMIAVVASDICNVVDLPYDEYGILFMAPIAEFCLAKNRSSLEVVLSCDEQALIPMVNELFS